MIRSCTECRTRFEVESGHKRQCSIACFLNARTRKTRGCWIWTGRMNKTGYGAVSLQRGRTTNAHRLAYLTFVGPIDEGKLVRHTCDNPSCVRPEHLVVGTNKENTADMLQRGRHIAGKKGQVGENTSRAKLTEKQVLEIRASHETQVALARRYGMSRRAIRAILARINWRHI